MGKHRGTKIHDNLIYTHVYLKHLFQNTTLYHKYIHAIRSRISEFADRRDSVTVT